MEIKKVMVIGAGQMGGGIAQVAAVAGYDVTVRDIAENIVQKGLGVIEKNLARLVEKGKLSAADKDAAVVRLKGTTSLEPAREADIVIEAAIEKMDLKREVFGELDRLCRPGVILASNTSSLPITEIAAATKRPDWVIGMHFMNPVPVMTLVEVIRGLQTSDDTFKTVEELAKRMGKVPVAVNDSPGFVSNRVLIPMINEAIFCVYEGVATPEAIDNVMKLGMNHPMGPLALADLIGLDTVLYILEVLYEGFADSKYRPCPLLRKMVKAGYLGRKAGKGFYDYQPAKQAGRGEGSK
ncbi:MAG: 3-hydroxybutyryl-CoA dehydrogenase [Bacillota bacterium]